uniref:Uncharacterized protein n=1 Tax=Amphimedon queenslandica TaxID=400682 RepID=A0A1X7UUU8_AMPQE
MLTFTYIDSTISYSRHIFLEAKSEDKLKKQQQIKERARLSPDRQKLDTNTLFRAINACSSKCSIFTVLPGYGGMVEDRLSTTDDVNLPKQLYHLYKPDYAALSSSELDQLVTDTFSNIMITTKEADYLEKSTRNQGNS